MLIILLIATASLVCYQRAERNRYAATLAEAMSIIDAAYVEEVKPREVYENAMAGMAEGLDPYSGYIRPTDYKQLQDGLDQKFGGVGIAVEVDPTSKRIIVKAPMPNTPAYRAGIKTGDVILKIDGRDTTGLALKDTVDLIQGAPGTVVRLTVLHVGQEEPVELLIKRAIIPVDSVLGDSRRADGTWEFTLADHPRLTYVRVTTFGARTVEELKQILQSRPVEALLIDLRDNSGGLLDAAVGTCELFIPHGQEVVSTRGRGGRVLRVYTAEGEPVLDPQVPLVVLANHKSASASEIVAACLQDHGRAEIVGQRSWGKGTVQNVFRLEGGRSALKLTTASYWRPSGKNIHRRRNDSDDADWGVRPDPGCEVVLNEEDTDRLRKQRSLRDSTFGPAKPTPPPAANGAAKKDEAEPPFVDLQLQKAIERLESRLAAPAAASAGRPATH